MMSLTHIATQSIPTVSWRPVAKAILSLVPTLSVPETRTGWRIPRVAPLTATSAPNPPTPPTTLAPGVFAAMERKTGTSACLSAMSTPADLYVMREGINCGPCGGRGQMPATLWIGPGKAPVPRGSTASGVPPAARAARSGPGETADCADGRVRPDQSGTCPPTTSLLASTPG